jgi:hypothetical protein
MAAMGDKDLMAQEVTLNVYDTQWKHEGPCGDAGIVCYTVAVR